MAEVRVDQGGIDQLLELPGLRRHLEERAGDVADRARSLASGIRVDGDPGDVGVPIESGLDTSPELFGYAGINHPAGLAVEAKHRILGSAITSA